MIRTPVCDLLGIEHPIALGGMGFDPRPDLVASVSAAGGFGAMGCHNLSPEQIASGVAAIRGPTDKPFALNFLDLPGEGGKRRRRAHPQAKGDGVRLAPAGAGFETAFRPRARRRVPGDVHGRQREGGEAGGGFGADIIVAQGTEGGGHVLWQTSMVVVPMVVDAVAPVPVLAAGGIADGRGLAAALSLGADAPCSEPASSLARNCRSIPISSGRSWRVTATTPSYRDPRSRGGDARARRDVARTPQPLHRTLGRAGMGATPGPGGSGGERSRRPRQR